MKQVSSTVREFSESFRKQPWFGDRMLMFGFLRPITWQGRLVALGFIVVCIADGRFVGLKHPVGIVVLLSACAVYALIAQLTSGRFWSWGIFESHPTKSTSTTKDEVEKSSVGFVQSEGKSFIRNRFCKVG
jgi:hypothetical protein